MTGAPSKSATRVSFRRDIQGLRAIAVLLVVLYHGGVTVLSGGYVGVDVFFVISGFLITSHIYNGVSQGSFRLRDFWSRRIRRLVPAAWTVVFFTLLAGIIWFPRVLLPATLQDAAATISYVPNVLFAWRGTDYLASETPSVFQHYWSLGVEEQFYVVWPLLLLLALTVAKKSRRALIVTVLTVTILSFIFGVWATQWRQPIAFFILPFRAWELGVGGLVALLLVHFPRLNSASNLKPVLGWLGVAAIAFSAFTFTSQTPFPGYAAAVPVLGTACAIYAGSGERAPGSPSIILENRPFDIIGRISYSLYLVHWPLLMVPQTIIGWQQPLTIVQSLSLAALSFPLAWLLWRYVEEPGRSNQRWWAVRSTRALTVGVVGACLSILLVMPVNAFLRSNTPVVGDTLASATNLSKNPQSPETVPRNLTPTLQTAKEDLPVIYDNDCHLDVEQTVPVGCKFGNDTDAPLVVLFGDSHAATRQPALEDLADRGKVQLEVHTKSSCSSAYMTTQVDNVDYQQCDEWRDNVLNVIHDEKPSIVILANFASYHREFTDNWGPALAKTVEKIEPESSAIIVEDVPNFGYDPVVCLSQNLQSAKKCDGEISKVLSSEQIEEEEKAAIASGAKYFKIDEWLCGKTCPAIQGNTLVYRDSHHLTASFSKLMAPIFEKEMLAE